MAALRLAQSLQEKEETRGAAPLRSRTNTLLARLKKKGSALRAVFLTKAAPAPCEALDANTLIASVQNGQRFL